MFQKGNLTKPNDYSVKFVKKHKYKENKRATLA